VRVRALALSATAIEALGAQAVRGDVADVDAITAGARDWVSSQECTIDIAKARRELGYRPVTGRADGLAELAARSGR